MGCQKSVIFENSYWNIERRCPFSPHLMHEPIFTRLTDNDFVACGLGQDVTNRFFETRHALIDGDVVDAVS